MKRIFGRFDFRSLFVAAVMTFWGIVACFAQSPPTLGGAAIRKSNASPPNVAVAQEVILVGSPSLIRVPNPWLWGKLEEPCAVFRVEADTSVNSLDLYTTGLGRTLLIVTNIDQSTSCPAGGSLRITIKKDANANLGSFVVIKVDSQALSAPGTSILGTVVAQGGTKKLSEFALKVERPPREELWAAGLWTLGVIIPAGLTFGFGQLIVRLTALQKEKNDFRDYRLANITTIHEFFSKVDTVIRAPQQHPGETVYEFIVANGVFTKMTRRGVRKLSAACVSDDIAEIIRALKKLFPEFEQPVARLENSLEGTKASSSPAAVG